MGLRRWHPLPAIVSVLVIAAACTGTSSTGEPTLGAATSTSGAQAPSVSASTMPTGPVPLSAGTLAAGTYATTAFDPALTFTLDDEWWAPFQDDEDEVALEYAGSMLAMTRPTHVVNAAPAGTITTPDDMAAWLVQHPSLVATKPTAVEIAGRDGLTFDIAVKPGPEEIDIFAYPTGNLYLSAGTRTRFWVLPMDGPDLAILALAEEARFREFADRAEQVLSTLVIAP